MKHYYYFRLISIIALSVAMLFSFANPILADGGPHEEVSKVDGYRVKLSFTDGAAQVGSNKLKIEIKDVLNQPVSNSKVTVTAELYKAAATSSNSSGHGMDMGEKKSPTPEVTPKETLARTVKTEMMAGSNPGEYDGEMNLEETGHWMIQVEFLILSRERVAEFPIEVYGKPNTLGILGSFLGINVIIITVAAVIRKKGGNVPVLEEAI